MNHKLEDLPGSLRGSRNWPSARSEPPPSRSDLHRQRQPPLGGRALCRSGRNAADGPATDPIGRCPGRVRRFADEVLGRSGRQSTPYFGYVAVELYFERFEVPELGLGPDAFDESQASLLTIEVAVEVEEMSLDE